MNKVNVLGDAKDFLDGLPTLEHYYFFDYLKISPSFQLARKYRKQRGKSKGLVLPPDFSDVLRTYDLVGDIFECTFNDWWIDRGHKLFLWTGKKKIALELDITNDKEGNIQEIRKILNSLSIDAKNKIKTIAFLKNKMRQDALKIRLNLVRMKAESTSLLPRNSMVDYAKEAKIKSWHLQKRKNGKFEKYTESRVARISISNQISKKLIEALYIAENAARLRFPTKEKFPEAMKFDYEFVENIFGRGSFSNNIPKHLNNPSSKILNERFFILQERYQIKRNDKNIATKNHLSNPELRIKKQVKKLIKDSNKKSREI